MSVQAQVPDDHPLMIAWEAYRASEDGKNSDRWARVLKVSTPEQIAAMEGQIIVEHPHLVGSLWAAFEAGFKAAGGKVFD